MGKQLSDKSGIGIALLVLVGLVLLIIVVVFVFMAVLLFQLLIPVILVIGGILVLSGKVPAVKAPWNVVTGLALFVLAIVWYVLGA